MAYVLPTFNITVNIWRAPWTIPPGRPADVVSPANLALGKRVNAISVAGIPAILLLLPKLTDVRTNVNAPSSDLVEAPAGTGRFYSSIMADDIAKGFANEHRFAVLKQEQPWPAPMP